MQPGETTCGLCATTRAVCFWGERTSYARWKRIMMLVISPLPLALAAALVYVSFGQSGSWFAWVLAVPVAAVGVFGFLAAIWGCDACVVRVWGEL